MKIGKHGLEKADERSIYPEMMFRILQGKFVSSPSNHDEEAELVTGKWDGKLWTIVANRNTGKVITARRAHGKEIRLYEEKHGC